MPRDLDVEEINRRLRTMGVTSDELTVEDAVSHLWLLGSLLERLRPASVQEVEDTAFKYRTAGVLVPREEVPATLDKLIPGWRAEG